MAATTTRRGHPGSVLPDDPYSRMRHHEVLDRAPRYRARSTTMPEVAGDPYTAWPDLIRDVFGAYHAPEAPMVLPDTEIRGDRALHRELVEALTLDEAFQSTRSLTRDKPLESCLATMACAHLLEGELTGRIADAARAQQDAQAAQDNLDRAHQEGAVPEDIAELTAAAEQAHDEARDAAQAARHAIAGAVSATTEEVNTKIKAVSTVPGLGPGERHRLPLDRQITLAETWTGNPALARIARLAGRLRRDMTAARSRSRTAHHTPIRPEQGDDLARLTADEIVAMRHPRLRRDFMLRLAEQQATCWQMKGDDHESRGPVVILADSSGSMEGPRNEWAKALAIACITIAHKDRRDALFVNFASASEQEVIELAHRARHTDLTAVATGFFGGGTAITAALGVAEGVIRRAPRFTRADIVLITDGHDTWGPDAASQHQRLADLGVQIHTIAVHTRAGDYLTNVSTTLAHTQDMELTSPNPAARSIAAAAL